MGDYNFDEFYAEIKNGEQIQSEEEAKLSLLDRREESYTDLVKAYAEYYQKKSIVNISLRKSFFI